MDWSGDLFAALDRAVAQLKAAAAEATVKVAREQVFEPSQRIVPRRGGSLARSARITREQAPDGETVTIGYGTEYAVKVHEDLTEHHDGGQQAKYLEGPLTEASRTALPAIADKIRV